LGKDVTVDEIRRGAFRRDLAALMGHIRAGLRDGAFGDNARACLDEMWKVATEEMVRVRNEALADAVKVIHDELQAPGLVTDLSSAVHGPAMIARIVAMRTD
jgi:hypothetical protein